MTIHDRALKAYPVTWAPNAEGIEVPTLGTAVAFNGDLQPIGNRASRLAEYGFDSTEAKGKVVFYDNDVTLSEGRILEDQTDMARYIIAGPPSVWQGHSEAIMVKWNG